MKNLTGFHPGYKSEPFLVELISSTQSVLQDAKFTKDVRGVRACGNNASGKQSHACSTPHTYTNSRTYLTKLRLRRIRM